MSETTRIAKVGYYTELVAHLHYIAFSRIALTEELPNIAYLFTAFSVSELVHALKFKDVLARLGAPIEETEPLQLDLGSTKTNLHVAAGRELDKIEATYPDFLERIRPEGDEECIRYCVYAWDSHKQHRDQIEQIRRWSGRFFGMVSRRMEKESVRYFVCRECGSTVVEVPENSCHICRHHVERYAEVPRPA